MQNEDSSSAPGRRGTILQGIGRLRDPLLHCTIALVLHIIALFVLLREFNLNIYAVIAANIFFALIGMGWAAINVNSLPMVVEMCKESDVGKYTGLYYTFSMSAQIVTPIVSGALLQYVSYRTLFPYSCVFMVAAFITMSMVRHGDNKPQRKSNNLEYLDVDD